MQRAGSNPGRGQWLRRIGWLVVIWVASVAALGVVAYGMRLFMGWAGLTR